LTARTTKKEQLDLIRDETLDWGRSHWTLLRCDRSLAKLSIINGSTYHWVEESRPLSVALDRIGDYLIDVSSDTRVLLREAQNAKTANDRLRIDGYLDALADASKDLIRSYDEIVSTVKRIFLNGEASPEEPRIIVPQRVTHVGLRTQLPIPSFSRGEVTWANGLFTSNAVFPNAPYTTPATERTRKSDQEMREADRG
jgi:hypothetical protein